MRIQSLLLLPLFTVQVARAYTFSEETDYGSDEISQNAYVDGDFGGSGKKDEDQPFYWLLNYNYTRTSTPNPGTANIVDNAYSYTGGLGWSGASEFGLDGKVIYSNTPDENLTVRGFQLAGSYRQVYGEEDDEGFKPYLRYKLLGSTTNYVETYNGEVAKKKTTKPVSGSTELRQEMAGFDVAWKPSMRWRFDLEIDKDFYNRNVGAFENQLDSTVSLERGMSGFADTTGGLADFTLSFTANWEFVDSWHLVLLEQYSSLAADGTPSTTSKLTVSDQFSKSWKATLGVEYLNSDVFTDTLGILGVECAL